MQTAPTTPTNEPSRSVLIYARKFVLTIFVIECVWLASLYASWGYVFWTAGHPPRMGDPASTPLLLAVAWHISGLLLLILIPTLPIALLISIVQAFRRHTEPTYLARTVFAVLLTLAAWYDPFGALHWWMD